jgi:hypothetical protein
VKTEENQVAEVKEEIVRPVRPFLLTMLCLFAMVFYGLMTVIFTFALFWSGMITDMVLKHAPENEVSGSSVFLYIISGFVLHASSLTGIILIWKMRRLGYLLLGISTLIIAGYHLLSSQVSPVTTAFYIGFILLFGLFLKKLK